MLLSHTIAVLAVSQHIGVSAVLQPLATTALVILFGDTFDLLGAWGFMRHEVANQIRTIASFGLPEAPVDTSNTASVLL